MTSNVINEASDENALAVVTQLLAVPAKLSPFFRRPPLNCES